MQKAEVFFSSKMIRSFKNFIITFSLTKRWHDFHAISALLYSITL